MLAQAFLSVALSGRDRALDRLNRQVAELSDMLSLERSQVGELQLSSASLRRDLAASNAARDQLTRDLVGLRADAAKAQADRDTLRTERDRLTARLADAEVQAQSALARNTQLQKRIDDSAGRTDAAGQETAIIAGQLAEAKRQLAQARTERAAAQAELDRTVQADRATIEAKLADVARLNNQLTTLTALRDELEKQVKDAASRATTDEQRRQALAAQLAESEKLGETARAQISLLNQQMAALRQQMQQVSAALDIAEAAGRDDKAQIANLSTRLNTALASKVEELQRYRSEFFGKLREVLQNRQDIQVVGDRFVFQSEVLFPAGSADLSASGQDQIKQLAGTLKQIAAEIPKDVNWLLRVDGHADKQPRRSGDAGNWELSAQRAINVVKLLVEEGIPANRLAATGFGEYQPLDPADTPAAYARNRRIELRLTDR
ncbi:MAG: peptidoglycan -binding protein [Acetobacteraceae bacterium]|nr:peptidoglycan -binding protein [Acetobacteraceae bacterium]